MKIYWHFCPLIKTRWKWGDLGRDPVRTDVLRCRCAHLNSNMLICPMRQKLAYTCCVSHETFKNVEKMGKENSRHMILKKAWLRKRELSSVRFSVRTQKAASHRTSTELSSLSRLFAFEQTNTQKKSVLASIHVNTFGNVLIERQ